MEINEIVGQDWLIGMFGIVISIYLFLLTLPIIFTHNALQEEMRELYTKYFMVDEMKKYHKFTCTIIYFFFLLGTHIVLYIIQNEFSGSSLNYALMLYDIVITISMILYIIFILRNIRTLVYQNPYTNKNIIDKIFFVLMTEFEEKEVINQKLLGEIISSFSNARSYAIRELILERIKDAVCFVVKNNRVKYQGEALKEIFDYCLREIALSPHGGHHRIQFQYIDVIEMYVSEKKILECQDDYYVTNFIILILRNSISNENWQITSLAIDQLHRLSYNYCELIELYEKLFACDRLDLLVQEINHITCDLHDYSENHFYALLAYVSMINSSTIEHKIFARILLQKIEIKMQSLYEWINKSINHFSKISKINIVFNLRLLYSDLHADSI